jgi:ribosomal protein S21
VAVALAPGESVDAAYRRLVREMVINGTFKQIEDAKYHVGSGIKKRDQRRQYLKTKRKRAQARRRKRNKYN